MLTNLLLGTVPSAGSAFKHHVLQPHHKYDCKARAFPGETCFLWLSCGHGNE